MSDAAPGAALIVRNLTKVFTAGRRGPTTTAVDDVTFEMAPGVALGIVGESGSGKSTLARMLVGLEQPSAGTITIQQQSFHRTRRTTDRRRRARAIQLVFQDPYTSLDPSQRVAGCLDEVLRIHTRLDRAAHAAHVGELLDRVGLGARVGGLLPTALSGGQRQRVAIARCLASAATMLILDEAVSALDVSVQSQVLNLLADLREETGLSYLFISHDLAVIRQVCDEVIVMRRGRFVERGTTDHVLTDPSEDYTRQLLASVPRPGWTPQRTRAEEPARA